MAFKQEFLNRITEEFAGIPEEDRKTMETETDPDWKGGVPAGTGWQYRGFKFSFRFPKPDNYFHLNLTIIVTERNEIIFARIDESHEWKIIFNEVLRPASCKEDMKTLIREAEAFANRKFSDEFFSFYDHIKIPEYAAMQRIRENQEMLIGKIKEAIDQYIDYSIKARREIRNDTMLGHDPGVYSCMEYELKLRVR